MRKNDLPGPLALDEHARDTSMLHVNVQSKRQIHRKLLKVRLLKVLKVRLLKVRLLKVRVPSANSNLLLRQLSI